MPKKPKTPKTDSPSERVLRILADRRLSQAVLAQLARMDRGHLNRVLRGRRPWTLPVLEEIARALDVAPGDLVSGTEYASLTQPNGAVIDRSDYEQTLEELAAVSARVRELEANLEGERASRTHLETANARLTSQIAAALRDRDEARTAAKTARAEESALRGEVERLQRDFANAITLRERQSTQIANLNRSLVAAHKQINANYDAFIQMRARTEQLSARLNESSGTVAGAALFTGLLGLGIGAAASRGKF